MRRLPIIVALAVLVFSALVVSGCAKKSVSEEPGRVHNEENGFSFIPPDGWEVSPVMAMGAFMTYVGPQENGFRVNFNVNANPHDATPAPQCIAPTKKLLEGIFQDCVIVDDGLIRIDDRKGFFLSSKFTVMDRVVQNFQYYMFSKDGKRVYVMTYTATPESFDRYEEVFRESGMTARID